MDLIQNNWYAWGSLVAFLVALFAAFGVFYDAQRKAVEAVAWKMLTVLAIVLILPSVLVAVLPDFRTALAAALLPLALLGIAATVAALLALLLYVAGIGTGAGLRCTNCNRPRDPSWPYCPYCEYDKPTAVAPTTPVYQPPPPPPPPEPVPAYEPPTPVYQPVAPSPEPLTPLYQPAAPSPQPPSGETLPLGPSGEPVSPTPKAPETRILRPQPTYLAYLVIRSGIHEGKTHQLGDVTNIGRQADVNDIVLDDDAVSRQHARVRFEDGKFVLFDLASSNGTFVQDAETGEWKKIHQRVLADRMMLKMGETVLSFMEVKSQ